MNKLSNERRARIVRALVEGNSIRATCRMTDTAKGTMALHFAYYNFCRIHSSLRVTLAMAAGVTDRLWDVEDLVALLD